MKKQIKEIIESYFNKSVDIYNDTMKSLYIEDHDRINLLSTIEDDLKIEVDEEEIQKIEKFDGKVNGYINKIIKNKMQV